jgi:hypothetical protein
MIAGLMARFAEQFSANVQALVKSFGITGAQSRVTEVAGVLFLDFGSISA